jgi:hypothetical protein
MSKEQITTTINKELLNALREKSEKEYRKLNASIELAIKRYLESDDGIDIVRRSLTPEVESRLDYHLNQQGCDIYDFIRIAIIERIQRLDNPELLF